MKVTQLYGAESLWKWECKVVVWYERTKNVHLSLSYWWNESVSRIRVMALCIHNFVRHNPPPPKNSWNTSLTQDIQLFKESCETLELYYLLQLLFSFRGLCGTIKLDGSSISTLIWPLWLLLSPICLLTIMIVFDQNDDNTH